jgi:CheY-like chemotaxis protein
LHGARILLTEDNEINQQIAVELLEGAGATVRVASNGREAVEILSGGPWPPPFDLVLMDLQMPEMDGYQATAKLRSDARFASLPIIAMTAHATIEERQNCLAAGMNDHIAKPIDPHNLFETVGRFCRPAETGPAAGRSASSSPLEVPVPEGAGSDPASRSAAGAERPEEGGPQTDELFSITGLDALDGLVRVAGNRKLYLKLLRQFAEQQGSAVDQIAVAMAGGDAPLAERLAHTIKGVAGNIGAKQVQSAAGVLEKLLRARAAAAEVDAARAQLAAALDPLVRELRGALDAIVPETSRPVVAGPAASAAQSRDAAMQLKRLLSEFDPGATDFIEANAGSLRHLFTGDGWARFGKLVREYIFAEAQEQLEQAMDSAGTV